ncbi:uncharacterized protein LOC121787159 [Salvia splendens]|uniref:uncharacterized protein LOC121787159 n=1 Tax=Salvia splendens TaxID=180675 RepID=UPI001C273307|nr:uncharacterized protein LOC121787159 [Salvia splendens]
MKPRLSDQRKLIHTNSRSTMVGTTRGMHAVEVPVIYRDFKASNILQDELKGLKNEAHVPAQAPAHSDWSKHTTDVEYPQTTLPLQKQACNPQTGVGIINSILLSIL